MNQLLTNAFVTFYYHFFPHLQFSQTDVKRLLNFSDCCFIDLLNQQSLYCASQDSHEESHRRFCLRCCVSLSYHWSANSDLILWLWDYFHKRMVGVRTFPAKSSHVQIFLVLLQRYACLAISSSNIYPFSDLHTEIRGKIPLYVRRESEMPRVNKGYFFIFFFKTSYAYICCCFGVEMESV